MDADADVWDRCSQEALTKYGYDRSEQTGLIASFLMPRLKTCTSAEEVGKRISTVFEAKPTSFVLEAKTKTAFLDCLLPLCSPRRCTFEKLDEAIAVLTKDEDNDLLQSFVTMAAGRVLKKEAEDALAKRKQSASASSKLANVIAKAKPMLDLQVVPDVASAVKMFAELCCAATMVGDCRQ